jgi:hypothetical protein
MTRDHPGLPRVWGASAAELAATYPSAELVPEPRIELFRAVDVEAPTETVYRWLCQLRIAPYSYDWIDNLGRRSPRALTPGLDALEVGQRVLVAFRVTSAIPGREFTAAVGPLGGRLFGPTAVTYRVTATEGGGSRLVVRLDAGARGRAGRLRARLLAWGDLVMMRRQLLNLAALAEGRTRGR